MWRLVPVAALVCALGLLPRLTDTDPALTVLKARSAERDPDPEVLAAIRAELGLDGSWWGPLFQWLGGLPRGDAGTSWVSGTPVLPTVLPALGASLLLMAGALLVAAVTAAAVCSRTLLLGARRRLAGRPRAGGFSAALAALPEFLTASVLAGVVGVQLGWLPALGWYGPRWMILPALALGLPAGAVLGRLLDDTLPGAFAEPWARAATARGVPGGRIARHALRRSLPGLLPNLGLFVVGLTGGAVAVEQIFDIPGLGRLTLRAAIAQDLPVLQTGILALALLAAAVGVAARAAARPLLGPALRDGALTTPAPVPAADAAPGARRGVHPLVYGAPLLLVVVAGLFRDPLHLDTGRRLLPPSTAHPLGTDALGRDMLARLGHGALATLGTALLVGAAALLIGVLLGLLPRFSGPLVDTFNAVPAVPAGLLVTGLVGPGPTTPAIAVAAVAWTPLAAHTSALLRQERAAAHLAAARGLGAGRAHLLRRHLLPAVLPPVIRHSLLRLPGIALALAALGFLGLGAQPPSPEWGLLLAENHPYAERGPWTVAAPALALALLGALAVTTAHRAGRVRRGRRGDADSGTKGGEAAPAPPGSIVPTAPGLPGLLPPPVTGGPGGPAPPGSPAGAPSTPPAHTH
ncbi:ABC transporter permease subunit [Streptomyces calidiresistens]